jgi:fluoride ion exporter CrcB/FEX
MVDTVRMLQRRNFGRAAWNGLGMIVVTVALALLGLLVGQSI